MRVCIIIPAYNEEKRIGDTLNEYSNYFENIRKKTKRFDYEILVSINNTKDKTLDVVTKYKNKNKRISYLNLINGGKGYAIIEGFKYALKKDNDLIGFVDADNATNPQSFWELLNNISDNDGIIGSRYLKGSKVYPKQPFKRIIASRMYNYFIRTVLLINFKDTQCGAKIFTFECIEKIIPNLTLSKWAFDVDILYNAKKSGFNIKEYPTTWSDKAYSKINFIKSGPMMVLGIIRLRLLNSPFHSIMRIYDKILNRMIE